MKRGYRLECSTPETYKRTGARPKTVDFELKLNRRFVRRALPRTGVLARAENMQFLDLLQSNSQLQKLTSKAQTKAQSQPVKIEGAPPASWASLAAHLARASQKIVVLVAPTAESGENSLRDLSAILPDETAEALYFPAPDRAVLDDTDDRNATQERLAVLDAVHREKPLIVTTAVAISHPTLPVKQLIQGYDELNVGQKLTRDDFIAHLSEAGYERVEEVEESGQFAARGGIIDFYPPAGGTPMRLELWGDEIDELRAFDVETQRSTEKLKSIRLTPPRELYLSAAKGREIAAQLLIRLDEEIERLKAFPEDIRVLKRRFDREIELLDSGSYFPGVERYRGLIEPQHSTLFDHLPDDALVIWAEPERAFVAGLALGRRERRVASGRYFGSAALGCQLGRTGKSQRAFHAVRGARGQRRRCDSFIGNWRATRVQRAIGAALRLDSRPSARRRNPRVRDFARAPCARDFGRPKN